MVDDRLIVRFNDAEGYRPATKATINYENNDYLSIEWLASDDVKIDSRFNKDEILDPKKWNIEVPDKDHFLKLSADNKIWIIEKCLKGKIDGDNKYGRNMKGFLDVKVDYGRPR